MGQLRSFGPTCILWTNLTPFSLEAATTTIATKAQLVELLTGVFGLDLPDNTHGLD